MKTEKHFKKIIKDTVQFSKNCKFVNLLYYGSFYITVINNEKYEIEIFRHNYDYNDFYCTNEQDNIEYVGYDKDKNTYLFRKLTDKLIKFRIWQCENTLEHFKKEYNKGV